MNTNHYKLNPPFDGLFCRKVNESHISANFSNLSHNPFNYSAVEGNQDFPLIFPPQHVKIRDYVSVSRLSF